MSKLLSVLAAVALFFAIALVPGATTTAEAKGAKPAKHGYVMKKKVKRVVIRKYYAWRPYWGWGYPYYWGYRHAGWGPYYGYGWSRPSWGWYRPYYRGYRWGWWGWRWWW